MEPRDIRTAFLLFPKTNKTIIIILNEIVGLANKEKHPYAKLLSLTKMNVSSY